MSLNFFVGYHVKVFDNVWSFCCSAVKIEWCRVSLSSKFWIKHSNLEIESLKPGDLRPMNSEYSSRSAFNFWRFNHVQPLSLKVRLHWREINSHSTKGRCLHLFFCWRRKIDAEWKWSEKMSKDLFTSGLKRTMNALHVWFERCRPSAVTHLGGFNPSGKRVAFFFTAAVGSSHFSRSGQRWLACRRPCVIRGRFFWVLDWKSVLHQNSETWNNPSFTHSFDLMLPWWFHVVSCVCLETLLLQKRTVAKSIASPRALAEH